MSNPCLLLEHVSYVLPNGRTLFPALNTCFNTAPSGLVGANGAGKTVLARILAGELAPSTGRCRREGNVRYLPQLVSPAPGETVASLAGVGRTLAALERIDAGSTDPADLDLAGDDWGLASRFQDALETGGLGHLSPGMPARHLSGGEQMRARLIGAAMADADFLILDEPGNHLDASGRRMLRDWLDDWQGGLLLISHDRGLLGGMDRILELSERGLKHYGGNYAFYAARKALEQGRAEQQVAQLRAGQKRQAREHRLQQERQQRRRARGNRKACDGSQAKILLNKQKERSEGTAARLKAQQEDAGESLKRKLQDAAAALDSGAAPVLLAVDEDRRPGRRLVDLAGVRLPHVRPPLDSIDLHLAGGRRLAVTGNNGCGKSILLKVLAGLLPPRGGQCRLQGGFCHLDQQLATLDPEACVLEQLRGANTAESEGELRTRLALLGFDEYKVRVPCGRLSGGERLKAALACALYADRPLDCLLLDEPDNHLDLASLGALEHMLNGFRGALAVVSHDRVFLQRLNMTHELKATAEGWKISPWPGDLIDNREL